MAGFVLLLRAINVGGTGKLPMADLRDLLAKLGAKDVSTYIQSGNAVLTSDLPAAELARQIEDAVEARFGFRRDALIIAAREFTAMRAAYPFKAAFAAPKTGHMWFLSGPANADLGAMRDLAADDEQFALIDGCFCLHAPSGIGRSNLAAKAEKLLGVPATARNLNSVDKICDMLSALPS